MVQALTSHLRRIGTPNTAGATRIMLLGSGELGKEIAIAFQRLGIEVVAVDRYRGAPATQVAHRSYVIDMSDGDELRRIISEESPDFVVPEIEALETEALAHLHEEGVTTVVPSPRALSLTMDREGIRRLAAEKLQVPTSAYAFAHSVEELRQAVDQVGLPCVVKPVMSSSGHGQSVLRTRDDIEKAWEYAAEDGRVNKNCVIVEEFVPFDYEITLLTVRARNPRTGETDTYFCDPIGHRQENGDYTCSWQPQHMPDRVLRQAQDIAMAVTTELGGRGIFGVELFIAGDKVLFSEVSPRPHDTGLVTLASQRLSEFELHARAILGLPVDTTLLYSAASSVIKAQKNGSGTGFTGVADALAIPGTDVRLFGKPEATEGRRMGVVVATGHSIDDALHKAQRSSGLISVVP